MRKDPELCQWAHCSAPSLRGVECCGDHRVEWLDVQDWAMRAALEYGDSRPGYWKEVDADPRWRRRWWEPRPEGRRPIPVVVRRRVAEAHGGLPGQVVQVSCPWCGAAGEISWRAPSPRFVGLHIDHIRPVSRGGGNAPENLRLLCPTCNISRGNREVA